jgi:hypothetical protein
VGGVSETHQAVAATHRIIFGNGANKEKKGKEKKRKEKKRQRRAVPPRQA